MIRHRHGNEFFLFEQNDHALLSGQIANEIHGGLLAEPTQQTIDGISLHDCGWPLHDRQPTLNSKGEPLHVFETPPIISTRVWSASSQGATDTHPYSGLLVSLHGLHLSLMSQASHQSPHDVFELNKFQHAQIELQERLRPMVGLRIDEPLTHGLAPPGTSQEEDDLLFDFRLLRAMDTLSLALLCSEDLSIKVTALRPRFGNTPMDFRVERPAPFTVRLTPWPFDRDRLEFPVPFRRLRGERFASEEQFRHDYHEAPIENVLARLIE
jgi:hypothetical protein